MNRTILLSSVLGLGLAVGVRATLSQAPVDTGEMAPVASSPQAAELRVLQAHAFQLAEPETHWMRAEAERYTQGLLLVLEADPQLLIPRQGYENVLYVGDETAEPLNVGMFSGHRVVIVPGATELAEAPIFFGEPELPERVTRSEARRQLELALAKGARPSGVESPGASLAFKDGYELRRFAADLIEEFAPDEVDVISGLRAERL